MRLEGVALGARHAAEGFGDGVGGGGGGGGGGSDAASLAVGTLRAVVGAYHGGLCLACALGPIPGVVYECEAIGGYPTCTALRGLVLVLLPAGWALAWVLGRRLLRRYFPHSALQKLCTRVSPRVQHTD